MSLERDAEHKVRDHLEALTGFSHPVFFQSGTAAIEALVALFSRRGDRIALPAFGCWTLSYALTKLGRRAAFCDVDRYWSARIGAAAADLAMLIDPWGGSADWRQAAARSAPSTVIADMTLAPGARLHGEVPAKWCTAGVLSLSSGKPLSLGAGGIALFPDQAHAREATRLFRFGFHDGRWARRVERYVFSPHLFPALAEKLENLPSSQEASASAAKARAVLTSLGLTSSELRPGGSWGVASCIPICLGRRFPLTPRDVEGVAVSSGFRLSRHPVSPPYLERAWGKRGAASCPRAEDLGARCLFFHPTDVGVDDLGPLFVELLAAPEEFRQPFPLARGRGSLPADLERLARAARLVRDMKRRYWLLDESDALMWPLDEREAAVIQARTRPPPRRQPPTA